MEYKPSSIESKWKKFWQDHKTYRVENGGDRPKFYILNMFPYPSGAGLHVGHPLGYIATDIFARYKRLKGFNVLNPMGYDSFGLPAEQYAIQTGQHPALTTDQNIATYRRQLDNIGFSFDWSREVRTSEPSFYKWTQWIFMQLFNSYYDKTADSARPIADLVQQLAANGNQNLNAVCDEDTPPVSAAEWNAMSERDQQLFLLNYRLTFPEESFVNWCAKLGSVLSNDEVKDGVSERGGYPVERKKMKQWSMRITAYADRLLKGLDHVDWSDALKEQQRNWIGRSQGASVVFDSESGDKKIEVFTTRIDTIFGVSFLVLAPEHEFVADLTTEAQRFEVQSYQQWAASRSDVDRQAEKKVSGAFTGAYAINPFSQERVPIYIADYVLAGYGTGAVMGVPSGDQRDWLFAKHFDLPIVPILDAQKDIDTAADATKSGVYINSNFINGFTYEEALPMLVEWLETKEIGKAKTQYRLRNAVFSRQRYWGEPVPAYWKDGVPYLIDESELPLVLPNVDKYLPTEEGEPPLGRAENWKYKGKYEYELSTMPGWAGSSWYFYRYMDAQNDHAIASKPAIDYWQQVDLYLGGSEHAVGHLLYSRFWNLFLYDLKLIPHSEYAAKLVNQGMILGRSLFLTLKSGRKLHINVNLADEKDRLSKQNYETMVKTDNRFEGIDIENDIDWKTDEDGNAFTTLRPEVEKMSKSKFNVVNPDDMIEKYGADCFRMYEMFLGPLEDSKPWNTNGISGVSGFLRKLWSLFYEQNPNGNSKLLLTEDAPTAAELKVLHNAIKRVNEDIARFSFNTCVSHFMICVNALRELKCHKRTILSELIVLLAPFAPFMSEELWETLGNTSSVTQASYPIANLTFLVESEIVYPISINGKRRGEHSFAADMPADEVENIARTLDFVVKWTEGATIKKIIVIPNKLVNIVI
ncbi:MAG: hypothetical protein RL757_10 [Bacteroidota bacterium]|jgi:leucyl-tRNA synthetase